MASSAWVEFWDGKHPIYVNARHEAAHFRRIAEDIRTFAPQGGVMLDYGCGEALSADRVAEPASRLILCEPAPNVRVMLGARFAANNKIAVRKPEDVAMMTAGTIDVVVMHSVTQYLTAAEFDALLPLFHRLLKPGGLLVVGDVIPNETSAFADARALLALRPSGGVFLGGAAGAVPHLFLGLLAASQVARAHPLRRPRNGGQAGTCRVLQPSRPAQTSATMTGE